MPPTLIDNTDFDTLCAAVSAPRHGPLVRLEDVSAENPNSHLPVLVKTNVASGEAEFVISYDDLAVEATADTIIEQELVNEPFDLLCAAVSAPRHGPLVRLGNVPITLPNEDAPVLVKTNVASGEAEFTISYTQLSDDEITDSLIEQALEDEPFDLLCAAVSAGRYGPLIRLESVSDIVPNEDLPVLVQTNEDSGEVEFYITFNQLSVDEIADRIIQQAVADHHQMALLKTGIGALNTAITAMTPPYTYTNIRNTVDVIKNLNEIKGY